MAKSISETAFATQVESLLNLYRWRWCHFRPALTGAGWRTAMTGSDPDGYKGKGIPDYICVRPPRLLFAELKDDVKKMTDEQQAWFDALSECVKYITLDAVPIKGNRMEVIVSTDRTVALAPTLEVYLWRPHQIEEIAEIIK